MKRQKYISWDDYFMGVALLSAQRSKDPVWQVGACIASPEKKIVGVGYNGFPKGCSDDALPWSKDHDDTFETKHPYVVHAELNAILNSNLANLQDCSLYVLLYPCNNCAQAIIQTGIKEVVYLANDNEHKSEYRASNRMFDLANVVTRQFETNLEEIVLQIKKKF